MTAEEDAPNLNNLPMDIIRHILSYFKKTGFLYIDNLRLISPRWNAAVSEYLNDREKLPVIERIDWTGDPLSNSSTDYTTSGPSTFKFSFSDYEEEFSYTNEEKAMRRVAVLINRCSRIESLELSKEQLNNNEIRTAITGLPIDEFSITGWPWRELCSQALILNFLRYGGQVRRLIFPSTAIECSLYLVNHCPTFFNEVVGLVDEVEISATGYPMPNCWHLERNDLNQTGTVAASYSTEEHKDGKVTYRLVITEFGKLSTHA
ncbi:hypothetical protein PMAYCL1PPCAC_22744 [Pristionchus mayeri]|uniref:F-box domain-containing protein n=1 Tax=Pristionchus mayeri TaxID=1317129 RepID=A0AAN5CXL7_9BILA|nr:hypothetical protein PMAYCL1PPCAC_22744 [Pristionchus mayeri]